MNLAIFKIVRFSMRATLGLLSILPVLAQTQEWQAQIGAPSTNKGHQVRDLLPNEMWIHTGDTIARSMITNEPYTGAEFDHARHDFAPSTSNVNSRRAEISFKLYQGYLIVVQGSIGPLQGLNFLIDTGTNPTAIDHRIANRLRLTGAAHKLALYNQGSDVREVVLPSLQVGPIRAESLHGMIQDLSTFEEACHSRIDAVIGFDVLSLSSFSIDFRSKKILFGPIALSPWAVPFDSKPPYLTLQFQIQDEPIRLLVDTGAPELVLFKCRLRGRLREVPVSSVVRRFLNGLGNDFGLAEMRLPGFRLGAADFGPQRAFSDDANTTCSLRFDGVAGVTRLGLEWVAFDFEHQRFDWKR